SRCEGSASLPFAPARARARRRPARPVASSGSAPASPAGRRGSARRAASRRRRRADPSRGSEEPPPVLLDGLAVELDPAARPQVLDHVPVDDAFVRPPEVAEVLADREVDRALDLLVEQRVPHVVLDAGVAADAELAEPPRALVCVEEAEQELLVRVGARLDDLPALEPEPHARDL